MKIHRYSSGMYHFYNNGTHYLVEREDRSDTHTGFFLYKEEDMYDRKRWTWYRTLSVIRKEFNNGTEI